MLAVKICGLRALPEALAAVDAGASYVGLVFVPGVRRQIAVEEAARIVVACRREWGGQGPKIVGLFANQPAEQVNDIAATVGLDMVQLCGDESLETCGEMAKPVLKVLHVEGEKPREAILRDLDSRLGALASAGHLAVLDSYREGSLGGAGESFDWSIAQKLASAGHRFLLAGGLTPHNVAEAVSQVRPYGVDVSSGVESGGIKDLGKIRAFIAAARRAMPP